MTDAIVKTEDAPIARRQKDDELSLALDADRFAQMQQIAEVMGQQSLLPDHLVVRPFWAANVKGTIPPNLYEGALQKFGEDVFNRSLAESETRTKANCFRVVNQAFRWRMDPFAIVDKTYSVGDGKLAYEGQLVAAVVNTRAGLRGRLSYSFSGKEDTDARTITVSGTFLDETEPLEITLSVGRAKTKNAIWTQDPDQKLVYSGSIKWARRYCPEIMLGVLTEDDLERIQMNVVHTEATAAPSVAAIIGAPPAPHEKKEAASEPVKSAPPPNAEGPPELTREQKTKWINDRIDEGVSPKAINTAFLAAGLIQKGETWGKFADTVTFQDIKDALGG